MQRFMHNVVYLSEKRVFMFDKIKVYLLRLKSRLITPRINRDIKNYKYIHVMHNDKFDIPFVDFLNKNFNPQEHMILCYNTYPRKIRKFFPHGKNVYEYVYFKDINGFLEPNIDKIIFHSLFMPGAVDRLYREPELLKKSYWVMWGGDLYNAPRDEKSDFVRKNFKGYINNIDKEYAIKKYGMKGKFYEMHYKFPLTKEILDAVKKEKKNYIKIQINNSCDISTLEMLDTLSKYKDENIKITTVLSYGKLQFKDEIIEKGKRIFGNKFEYIDKFMKPADYARYLAQNDILILNQNRQQGFGNTLASLYLGLKVFIRSEISTNKYLNDSGIKIYNVVDIINNSFEEFTRNESVEQNKQGVQKFFDDDYLKSLLDGIFRDKE